ncbi:MAG: MBL fold metallo-hydrolase [Spirochaetae bacterium HGW-Spirochaetae-1]|jgi:ribonuclease BN (tRNA processing enzyme)|nr:MAG: MBL fold metallo-hydrolase [Spirochaetae bacterium HGW-Spirochaetae-1]
MGAAKITLLGTNGWYDTDTGNTISILVQGGGNTVVFDAGNGIHKLDRHLDGVKEVYCFLSHFHLDHIMGLHVLPKFFSLERFTVIGQAGTRDILKSFQSSPFTVPPSKLPFEFSILEAPRELPRLPFSMETLSLLHSDATIGARIEICGKIIAYCPDTGYCENAVTLARDADMLLAECAYPPGFTRKEWPHLNPETAARIALEAGAKKLVLVHFDAHNYRDRQSRLEAQAVARTIFPETVAGMDDMEFTV